MASEDAKHDAHDAFTGARRIRRGPNSWDWYWLAHNDAEELGGVSPENRGVRPFEQNFEVV